MPQNQTNNNQTLLDFVGQQPSVAQPSRPERNKDITLKTSCVSTLWVRTNGKISEVTEIKNKYHTKIQNINFAAKQIKSSKQHSPIINSQQIIIELLSPTIHQYRNMITLSISRNQTVLHGKTHIQIHTQSRKNVGISIIIVRRKKN